MSNSSPPVYTGWVWNKTGDYSKSLNAFHKERFLPAACRVKGPRGELLPLEDVFAVRASTRPLGRPGGVEYWVQYPVKTDGCLSSWKHFVV